MAANPNGSTAEDGNQEPTIIRHNCKGVLPEDVKLSLVARGLGEPLTKSLSKFLPKSGIGAFPCLLVDSAGAIEGSTWAIRGNSNWVAGYRARHIWGQSAPDLNLTLDIPNDAIIFPANSMLKCYSNWFNAFDEGWATLRDGAGNTIAERDDLTSICRGLSVRLCVIPLSTNSAMLQCHAFPTSTAQLQAILDEQNALDPSANWSQESSEVPCLMLPFGKNMGIAVALGIVEDPAANFGMGLLPPLVVTNSVSQVPALPSQTDIDREMTGLLRSVALPNAKNTGDLMSMLAQSKKSWEDFDPVTLPAIWQEFDGTRHRSTGRTNIYISGQILSLHWDSQRQLRSWTSKIRGVKRSFPPWPPSTG